MPEIEAVSRVGLAGWVAESESENVWDAPTVLGIIGDDLHLVEIGGSNRERILAQLVDEYEDDDRGLRIDLVFFGDAGGFFASSMHFLELWPKSPADVPADVFVDIHYRAAFTKEADEVIVSMRHAMRPSGPPRRQFRFHPNEYEAAISELARQSRRVRDELIAVARQRVPQKVALLQAAFESRGRFKIFM